jgi:hypothetical protein
VRIAAVAFLLKGVAWYVLIQSLIRGISPLEGATVVGHLYLVDPPLFPFYFFFSFFGRVFAAALALCFIPRLPIVSGGCYINIARRNPVSRRRTSAGFTG